MFGTIASLVVEGVASGGGVESTGGVDDGAGGASTGGVELAVWSDSALGKIAGGSAGCGVTTGAVDVVELATRGLFTARAIQLNSMSVGAGLLRKIAKPVVVTSPTK